MILNGIRARFLGVQAVEKIVSHDIMISLGHIDIYTPYMALKTILDVAMGCQNSD